VRVQQPAQARDDLIGDEALSLHGHRGYTLAAKGRSDCSAS
jgi:hypothetical protein